VFFRCFFLNINLFFKCVTLFSSELSKTRISDYNNDSSEDRDDNDNKILAKLVLVRDKRIVYIIVDVTFRVTNENRGMIVYCIEPTRTLNDSPKYACQIGKKNTSSIRY